MYIDEAVDIIDWGIRLVAVVMGFMLEAGIGFCRFSPPGRGVASGARFRVAVAGGLALAAGVAFTVLIGPSPCLARYALASHLISRATSIPSLPPWRLPWPR
jgi:hypothetical protein